MCYGACVRVPEVPAVISAKTMFIHSCDAVENVEETTKPKDDRVESMSGPMGLRSDVWQVLAATVVEKNNTLLSLAPPPDNYPAPPTSHTCSATVMKANQCRVWRLHFMLGSLLVHTAV